MPKRTFDHVEPSSPTVPPSSSPSKRIHTSTPASRSTATCNSVFSTPYTPSVYSTPADSPTNPLGLKRRVNNLTLPKATPFSKHVALRFQLVTTVNASPPPASSLWDASPDSLPSSSPSADAPKKGVYLKNPAAGQYARQGTYRIVQVPLSYTFRHLRALIQFLFSCDPDTKRPCVPGHLFAVQRGISTGGPGEITRGRLRVKLSCARDPYYSSRSLADLIAVAETQGQGEEDLEDEEEDASWRWEGEDDFTLGHVWEVRSRDPTRGIIYHHDDTTAVHITLNTQSVPHRKGVGNMPFVFRAYGDLHLDPPPPRSPLSSPIQLPTPASLPRPPRIFPAYKRPTKAVAAPSLITSGSTIPLYEAGDTDVDDASSSDEDDFDGGLDPRVWNHTGAFPRFLSALRSKAPSSSSSSSPSPSPTAPPSPSSPVRISLSSSSPTRSRGVRRATTMPYSATGSGNTSSAASLSLPPSLTHLPGGSSQSLSSPLYSSPTRSLPSMTPAPARARTRYRVARAARRLLGLAERGLESAAAEEADGVDGRVQGLSKKGGGGGSSKGDGRKGKAKSGRDAVKSRPKTKTITGDANREVRNPFAHLKDAS